MPLLLGRARKPGLWAGQRCSLALLGGGSSGSLAAVHAGKHVSIWECPQEGHPGLVLSCCELQSCENYFCVRSLWVKEERDPHAPSHPIPSQTWHRQPACTLCARMGRSRGAWQERFALCSPGMGQGGRVCVCAPVTYPAFQDLSFTPARFSDTAPRAGWTFCLFPRSDVMRMLGNAPFSFASKALFPCCLRNAV